MTVTRLYLVLALLLVLLLLLAGCESVRQMSDSWCDEHPQAPNSRCWGHTYAGRGNTP